VTSSEGPSLRDPKDEISYRLALLHEAPALMAIVQAGFETYRDFAPAGWEPPDETRPEMVARMRDEIATGFVLVAQDGDELAGHVTLVPGDRPSADGLVPDFHLRHLFVLPRWWGSGVARELHARALERSHGTARLYTPAGQARARRFYEREGWELHLGPHFVAAIGLELVEYRLTRDPRPHA